MSNFLNYAIPGIPYGCEYALIAVGLVLTFRATGVFNLAFGAQAFVAAFAYDLLNQYQTSGPSGRPSSSSVLVISPALGLALDRFLFRHIPTASTTAKVLSTLGLLIAIPLVLPIFFGRRHAEPDRIPLAQSQHRLPATLYRRPLTAPSSPPPSSPSWWWPRWWPCSGGAASGCRCGPWWRAGAWPSSRGSTPPGWRPAPGLCRAPWPAWPGCSCSRHGRRSTPPSRSSSPPCWWPASPPRRWPASAAPHRPGGRIGARRRAEPARLASAVGQRAPAERGPGLPLRRAGGGAAVQPQDPRQLEQSTDPLAVGRPPAPAALGSDPRPAAGHPHASGSGVLLVAGFVVSSLPGCPTTGSVPSPRASCLSIIFLSITLITGMAGQLSLCQATFAGVGRLRGGQMAEHFGLPVLVGAVLGGIWPPVSVTSWPSSPSASSGLPLTLVTLAFAIFADQSLFQYNWSGGGDTGVTVPRPVLVFASALRADSILPGAVHPGPGHGARCSCSSSRGAPWVDTWPPSAAARPPRPAWASA